MISLAGFISWVRSVMGLSTTVIPDNSTDLVNAYNWAVEIVSTDLASISSLAYQQAVYNLAGDILVNWATDQPNQTVFSGFRNTYKIFDFVPGVLTSTSDSGTSQSMNNPEFMKNLTLSDLQNLKTPWGRAYLAIAQRLGTLWGLS